MIVKAVGLLSGGLDSALACKLLKDQGIEVHAVYIDMPWGCGKADRARRLAEALGVAFAVIPLEDDYLSLLKKPKHGFGTALNPCVDCHAYMVRKAGVYMQRIGAAFVFTGEVLGQRPMSQRRQSLRWVEEEGGLAGRVLRPLSAGHLDPTVPEQQGLVDRGRLLSMVGRSRSAQFALARELGVSGFAQPGGGCLLTEQVFAERVRDTLFHGCRGMDEITLLAFGRYFRLGPEALVVVGRDMEENEALIHHALDGDIIFRAYDFPSPTAVLRSAAPTEADLQGAAGLMQFFSKQRGEPPRPVSCWFKRTPGIVRQVTALSVPDEPAVAAMRVG